MDPRELKETFDALRADRKTWDAHFQILGEYIAMNKQDFQGAQTPGEFLVDEIFDATGAFAAHNAASALLGMLWPGTARQAVEITPPDDLETDTELAEFYERMTDRLVRAMDDPKANLSLSLDEYMLDQMIFATSGVGVEKGDESKLLFKPYGVKEMYIDEGKNGRVDAIYLFFEWTVKRVVKEYGLDAVSDKVREKWGQGKRQEKVKVLICITERTEFKATMGALSMPYQSVHIEYDSNHVLKESGFGDLPIKVGRFRKLNYERYGRSPAMNALPDIREANVLREAVIVATEKALDMPKGVLDDGMLGGGVIDTSARAINVFNATSASNGPPIFDIGTPPDIRAALQRLEELKNAIAQHFNLDRLIDFNNQTQMTFGEAQIRNAIRNASLSSLFSRQISEVLTPLIVRCVSLLFEAGEFGVVKGSEQEQALLAEGKEPEYIPDILVQRLDRGEDIYAVTYKTQAANASKSELYIGILDVLSFGIQGMQVDPTLQHRVDLHKGLKEIGSIRGLPVGILRQDDEVDKRIAAGQQQAAQQQQLEAGVMGADIVDKLASANKAVRM
jgi:hypothetical protein